MFWHIFKNYWKCINQPLMTKIVQSTARKCIYLLVNLRQTKARN